VGEVGLIQLFAAPEDRGHAVIIAGLRDRGLLALLDPVDADIGVGGVFLRQLADGFFRVSAVGAGFEIKKKIDFENKEKIGDWRKKLSYKL
jgi:hypothetical protein